MLLGDLTFGIKPLGISTQNTKIINFNVLSKSRHNLLMSISTQN